jgi:hypothetical protein
MLGILWHQVPRTLQRQIVEVFISAIDHSMNPFVAPILLGCLLMRNATDFLLPMDGLHNISISIANVSNLNAQSLNFFEFLRNWDNCTSLNLLWSLTQAISSALDSNHFLKNHNMLTVLSDWHNAIPLSTCPSIMLVDCNETTNLNKYIRHHQKLIHSAKNLFSTPLQDALDYEGKTPTRSEKHV